MNISNPDTIKDQANDILSIEIPNKDSLYAAYMSFIKNGALFIATDDSYNIGDEVLMSLKLLDEPEKHSITTKVVWINPPGTLGKRNVGVGVQFIHQGAHKLRDSIETYLTGYSQEDRPSETM